MRLTAGNYVIDDESGLDPEVWDYPKVTIGLAQGVLSPTIDDGARQFSTNGWAECT